MDDFTKSIVLLMVGVAAGAVPTAAVELARWRRDRALKLEDSLQRVLVELMAHARDVRYIGGLLAECNETGGAEQRLELVAKMEASIARFQHAYHELSITGDGPLYERAQKLNVATLDVRYMTKSGRPSDPEVIAARDKLLDCRRDLRDHIRKVRRLDNLGKIGRTPDYTPPGARRNDTA